MLVMPNVLATLCRYLPVALALASTSCLQWRRTDAELAKHFGARGLPIAIYHGGSPGAPLRYIEVRAADTNGSVAKPNILFIHGAPSSLRVWEGFLADSTLLAHANLFAVDRPGYGYSNFGSADTSIIHQAEVLLPMLKRHAGPWLVFGSSYGGPIGCVLAAKEPKKVKAILLTSPALAPGRERIYGISYIVRMPAFGWLFPTIFRVANAEKLSHANQLRLAAPYYRKVAQPITYIHGSEDALIWPSNASYADSAFSATCIKRITLQGRPHFFTFSEQPLIVAELLALLATIADTANASN